MLVSTEVGLVVLVLLIQPLVGLLYVYLFYRMAQVAFMRAIGRVIDRRIEKIAGYLP